MRQTKVYFNIGGGNGFLQVLKLAWNFFVMGATLYVAARFFPESVSIDSTKTLIIATLLLWVVTALVAIAIILVMAVAASGGNVILMVVSLVALFFSRIFALMILSAKLAGFTITGGWTYLILALVMGIFTVGNKNTQN